MSSTVAKVAVPVPLPGLFDYLPLDPECPPAPGQRVVVPFGARRLVGLVLDHAPTSNVPAERLQRITGELDEGQPIVPAELRALLAWCARYYKHPIGEVMFNALPPALRRADGGLPKPPVQYRLTEAGQLRLEQPPGRETAQHRLLTALADGPLGGDNVRGTVAGASRSLRAVRDKGWVEEEPLGVGCARLRPGPQLTDEQQRVVSQIGEAFGEFRCHLVDGITGSGKTEIYLHLLARVLGDGRQALVLVPEIGLTPQLLRRFRDRLGIEPVVSHSGIAAGERTRAWAAAARGEAGLFIGTRSALFLPLRKPGLIVMDESHDPSYKQQDGFRFSARDVAVKRAASLGVPIVLGTATPSLESLHNAATGRYRHHRLLRRATGAPEPSFRVVDLRRQSTRGGLSGPVLRAMEETLAREEQVLVFLNRRGYAPVLLCHDCGWHAGCGHCDANLTWHRAGRLLLCHHCDRQQPVPRLCPECGADALQGAGDGTEQLEQTLKMRFPCVDIHRVDRDRVRRKGELERLVDAVREGRPCILAGTQMLAKGHHFPRVTLVVIVNLDQALHSADFRAMERMGQLLVQVAGRAGRDRHAGTVLLQTHHPDHQGLQLLIRSGYSAFANQLLDERRLTSLPPFTFQATLRAEAGQRERVLDFLEGARDAWPGAAGELFGPFPAMMERRSGRLRWYLLVQSCDRRTLQARLDDWLDPVRQLPAARRVRWTVDIDPQEF